MKNDISLPLVSICTPVYMAEEFISDCCKSIFGQTYKNLECIFIDDKTPDKSINILRDVLEEYPQRKHGTKIIHHADNYGVARSRNDALDSATGEFIIWVDADDWLEPNAVEILVCEQKKTNADIVLFDSKIHYPEVVKIKKQPTIISKDDYLYRLIESAVPYELWGRLIKRQLFEYPQKFRLLPDINIAEDYECNAITTYYANSISNVSLPLYNYNCKNAAQLTHKEGLEIERQSWEAFSCVEQFYRNKGTSYSTATNLRKLFMISCCLINYGINPKNKFFLEIASNRYSEITDVSKISGNIPLYRRILYYLMSYPSALTCYVRIAKFAKKNLMKVHKKDRMSC